MWEAVLQHSIDHHVRFYWSQSFILRPKYEWLLTTVDWPVFLCGWSHKPRTHLHRHSHKMDTTLIKPYSYQFTDLYIMSDVCDTAMYATNGGAWRCYSPIRNLLTSVNYGCPFSPLKKKVIVTFFLTILMYFSLQLRYFYIKSELRVKKS